MLAQQIINGLVAGSVYALFALGFTLIFGVLHILNLAHGAVFTWGAFAGLYAITLLHMPLAAALPLAMLVGGVVAVAVDWVAFRPLRKRQAPEFSAIISSIGASLVLLSIAQRASETKVVRYPFGTFPVTVYEILGVRISLIQLIIVGGAIALVSILLWYLYRTSFGRQIRAVAVNDRTAALLGVNPDAVYLQTFFISGALAAAAGVVIGVAYNSVHFLMGEPFMLRAFVVVVLGGLGSVSGALLAGLLLGLIHTLSVAYLSTAYSDAILFTLLFVILLIRPTGFFGTQASERRVARR
jgi:branched-chain amino acid transport system permease protein